MINRMKSHTQNFTFAYLYLTYDDPLQIWLFKKYLPTPKSLQISLAQISPLNFGKIMKQ
jgi:hypothetical protein